MVVVAQIACTRALVMCKDLRFDECEQVTKICNRKESTKEEKL